jgi:asparagine synthase (glutamine-hydrolysing)
MSGIYGKIGEIGNDEHVLSNMSDSLIHRGPDDEGIYKGNEIMLGCRLLRTRGPDEGRQPISSDLGDIHAVMDGAIYNGDTLRSELESRGCTFHMNSDTELLIRLYQKEGLDCVKRIRGHFAFALWDNRSNRLVLARDHLGQKPLFYSQIDGKLYFASEVKALLPVLPTTAQIDFESLDRYLSMRFIPGSGTMVREIKKLPPAHLLVCENENISVSRYWRLSFAEKISLSHDGYIEGLESKFQETVAAHLTENEATGAFLSGGLDSSLIVAMMAREAKEPISTFSIGFAEKEFDEITYARMVSEKFGTHQYEAQADTDLIKALPTIIDSLGEPSDPVAVSFYTASRLAAGHVKVVLGGDGGNELFAGCDRYRGVLLSRYYSLIPNPIRKAIVPPLINAMPASFGYDSLKMKLRWFEKMAGIQGLGECLAEAVSFFRFSEDEKDLLLERNIRQRLDRGSAAKEISDRYYESDAEHPIERMLYTDYCTRLPEHLLMLVDRMGMAHSLEIRSPLVDKELVEYMAAFPLNMKVRGQKSRYIWYKLAERLLPPAISRRKKRGFRFPLAYWFAVKLNPFLHNVFEDSALVSDKIFSREYMLKLLHEHRDRNVDHSWKIWMLLNLEIWYRMTIQGFSLEQTQDWIERHVNSSAQ